jgi:hypothetical protein
MRGSFTTCHWFNFEPSKMKGSRAVHGGGSSGSSGSSGRSGRSGRTVDWQKGVAALQHYQQEGEQVSHEKKTG